MKYKKLWIIIVSILIIILFGIRITDAIIFGFEPSKTKVQKTLNRDMYALEQIGKSFLASDYSDISWDCFGVESINYKKNNDDSFKQKIDESEFYNLKQDFANIADKKYISITKEENYVSYTLWLNWGGSVSLIYSPNTQPEIYKTEYDTYFELSDLSPSGWYYFKIMNTL